MITPAQMLAVLDDAIAAAPRGWRGRRRAIVLELHAPAGGDLWGVRGRYLNAGDGGPVYGYTKAQCYQMRKIIRDAAIADAGVDPRG